MALRQSTGGQFFNTVPLIDDTDFKTPENGLAASVEASLEIAKNGGVMGPATGATVALNSNGTYRVTLTAGNVDTAGDLDWQVFVAGALIAYGSQIVYAGTGFDLLFGAATLDVNVTEISGTAVTETSPGNLAGNFSTFYDNGDSSTVKIVDEVGNLTRIIGTLITESSPGRIAGNFDTFFDNVDAATTKKVDDVGGVAGGVTDVNVVEILGETLTETTPGLVGDNFSGFFDAGGSALGGSNAGGINLASGPSNQSILSAAYNNTDVDPTSSLAVSDLNNILLSAMLGRMLYNPDTGNTEWYAFDNVTLLYEVNTSIVVGDNDTERTRLSYTAPPPPP